MSLIGNKNQIEARVADDALLISCNELFDLHALLQFYNIYQLVRYLLISAVIEYSESFESNSEWNPI